MTSYIQQLLDTLTKEEYEDIRTIWYAMHSRCYKQHHPRYDDYGGRGIYVVKRWHSLDNFILDMGMRPEGMTIERMENDGPYGPLNCCWATPLEQAQNRRVPKPYKKTLHNGKPLKEWAEIHGIQYNTLRTRLAKGMPFEQAVSKEKIPRKANPESLRSLAKQHNIVYSTLVARIARGVPLEEALKPKEGSIMPAKSFSFCTSNDLDTMFVEKLKISERQEGRANFSWVVVQALKEYASRRQEEKKALEAIRNG